MIYHLDDNDYEVIIIKKNNKNTYIRVKEDLKIYVTTHFWVTKKHIKKLLDDNISYLRKAVASQKKKKEKSNLFFYLGNAYDIIEVSSMKKVEVDNDNCIIYTKDSKMIERWLKKQIIHIFTKKYEYCFSVFDECNVCPKLKFRTMKSRWGVYNRKNHSITLNTHLIEYTIDKLEYVIFHELSHTMYFDHSKSFWQLVSKYCPNYKKITKELKE